jgi:hypothetical protein
MVRDKGSGSFLKKRTKKLLYLEYTLPNGRATAPDKSFCFFSSEKKVFLKVAWHEARTC